MLPTSVLYMAILNHPPEKSLGYCSYFKRQILQSKMSLKIPGLYPVRDECIYISIESGDPQVNQASMTSQIETSVQVADTVSKILHTLSEEICS